MQYLSEHDILVEFSMAPALEGFVRSIFYCETHLEKAVHGLYTNLDDALH